MNRNLISILVCALVAGCGLTDFHPAHEGGDDTASSTSMGTTTSGGINSTTTSSGFSTTTTYGGISTTTTGGGFSTSTTSGGISGTTSAGSFGGISTGTSGNGSATTGGACVPASSGPTLIDPAAAWVLTVAPTESVVAVTHDYTVTHCGEGCGYNSHVGTVVLASTCGNAPVTLGTQVDFYSVAFTGDGQHVVYVDDIADPCGSEGNLKIANIDGSNVQLIAQGATFEDYAMAVINTDTFFFFESASSDTFAATLSTGTVTDLGNVGQDQVNFSPSGSAIAIVEPTPNGLGPTLIVEDVSTTARTVIVDGTVESSGNAVWSPDGNHLVFEHGPMAGPPAISVVDAHGGNRVDLPAALSGYMLPVFSSDSGRLAYATQFADGTFGVAVHDLRSGQDASIHGIPANTNDTEYLGNVSFSPDGNLVFVYVIDETNYGNDQLFIGSLQSDFRLVSPALGHVNDNFVVTPDDAHVAVVGEDQMVHVVDLASGLTTDLPGYEVAYEPGTPTPRLLVTSTNLGMYTADGRTELESFNSGVSAIPYGGWLGHDVVLLEANATGTASVMVELDAAGNTRTLASDVTGESWAPIAAPTRIFFNRDASSDPSMAGLWVAPL
ncbi:MAG: PD40 domain-containing protein [Deltaproteobacteria bacterium]|nr:PD40 domain-containing protein [Deltaproteobacteria bacterium]